MKVRKLIELLQQEDPERLVIVQKDAEGNEHSPFSSCWAGAYKAETTWYGEAGFERLTPELEAAGYSEDDLVDDGVSALFLVPVN